MASKSEFVAAMAALHAAELIERRSGLPPESTVRESLYWELLQDVPGPLLLSAAKEHIAQCKFFPTIAELRETALRIQAGAGIRQGPLSPEEAFEMVGDYVANRGETDEPPPAAMRAYQAVGGWWEWTHSERPGLLRKDFLDAYRAFVAAEVDQAGLLPSTKELQRRLSIQRVQEEAERLLLPAGGDDAED